MSMKAYVISTGGIFVLITPAQCLRIYTDEVERAGNPRVHRLDDPYRGTVSLGVTTQSSFAGLNMRRSIEGSGLAAVRSNDEENRDE